MLSIQALGQQNLAAIASVSGTAAVSGAAGGANGSGGSSGSGGSGGAGQSLAAALYGMDGRMLRLQASLVSELFSALA